MLKHSPHSIRLTLRLAMLVLGLALSGPGWAARLALVIGNDNYQSVERLRNARNDAKLVAGVLNNAGFDVSLASDLGRTGLWRTIDTFKGRINKGDEVVFYFAGHGVQIGANQLLLPTDIAADNEAQVQRDGVSLIDVQDAFRDARIAMLLIDACRDNPFPRQGTRSIGGTRGLNPPDVSTGQLIMMSAGRNQKALDHVPNSTQANGLFAHELSQVLQTPGIEIRTALERVKNQVDDKARKAGHEQRPSLLNDLRGDFYLLASVPPLPKGVAVQPPPQPDPDQEAWELAKRRDTVAAYQAYLRRYPQGRYTDSAQVALEGLQPAAPNATAAPAATPSVSTAPAPAAQNTPTAHPISPPSTTPQPAADSTLDGRYQVLAAGEEVKDLNTGLVWQRCSVGQKWNGQICAGVAKRFPELHLAQDQARNGWRLPSKNELASLVDSAVGRPAIHPHAFPATPAEWFWSSSTVNSDVSWYVNFYDGRVFNELNRRFGYYALVRLVR